MFPPQPAAGKRLRHAGAAACLAAALVGATPADAPPAAKAPAKSPLKRLSIAEFVKDPGRLASLRKGVKKMRELDVRDPRSWAFQANIHWRPFFPVYVNQQAAGGKDAARQVFRDDPGFTPDPNVFSQCPHGNWWFLPWHRAYLYYFERVLRWAADDPNLALPYWNYADPGQRELPPAFREPKAGGQDNPLYLPESATFTDDQGRPQVFLLRDGPLLRGDTQLTASAASPNVLAVGPFVNPRPLPANQGFGGERACDPTCACGFGALEAVPHNRVHTAVGGSQAMAGGSVRVGFMGDTSTAARDPIFWLHHANVDRLWVSWRRLQGHNNPDDPEWLQQAFTFYDVDGGGKPRPVTVTVQDLLTTEPLGYVYDSLEEPPVVLASFTPKAPRAGQVFKALAATAAPARHPGEAPHAPGAGPAAVRLGTTRTQTVPVPLFQDTRPEQVRALAGAKPAQRKFDLLLSLEGIEADQLPGVDYDVYLNLPAGAKASPENPYHVGALTFFGTTHLPGTPGHAAHKAPRRVAFAISPELLKVLSRAGEDAHGLTVTFVPGTGTEPTRKGARVPGPAERPAVTIRQIRLLYVH
jgi:tyrosinase